MPFWSLAAIVLLKISIRLLCKLPSMTTAESPWKTSIQLKGTTVLRIALARVLQPVNVVILGMHRSGTSCLTGILSTSGLYLGDTNNYSPFNQKGNQESRQINELNESLLKHNHGSWKSPKEITNIPDSIKQEIERYQLRKMLQVAKKGQRMWGIKDPRMLFCLPAWSDRHSTFVGTFRHPQKVAQSLLDRDKKFSKSSGMSLEDWQEVWYVYNLKLVEIYQQAPFPIVSFDWESKRYAEVVSAVAQKLQLPNYKQGMEFFDGKLINQEEAEITNSRHAELYAKLQEIADTEAEKLLKS